jgi:ABC-2 type transport system permease protein
LMIGLLISTISQSQFQAVQIANVFSLINIVFSGFLFPFAAMPLWGRWVGSVLPATHFLRIMNGIMLKGNGLVEISNELWPMILFATVLIVIAGKCYKQRLD